MEDYECQDGSGGTICGERGGGVSSLLAVVADNGVVELDSFSIFQNISLGLISVKLSPPADPQTDEDNLTFRLNDVTLAVSPARRRSVARLSAAIGGRTSRS